MKFESVFYNFHSRKCIQNCLLPKWRPFCAWGDELRPLYMYWQYRPIHLSQRFHIHLTYRFCKADTYWNYMYSWCHRKAQVIAAQGDTEKAELRKQSKNVMTHQCQRIFKYVLYQIPFWKCSTRRSCGCLPYPRHKNGYQRSVSTMYLRIEKLIIFVVLLLTFLVEVIIRLYSIEIENVCSYKNLFKGVLVLKYLTTWAIAHKRKKYI